MPSLKVHCAFSKERTGNNYAELHGWIDALAKDEGINHRKHRHSFNIQEEDYIRSRWGEKAVVEWLFHIALDNLDTGYKISLTAYGKEFAYNFFKFGLMPDSKFIYFGQDRMNEGDMEDEFKGCYE